MRRARGPAPSIRLTAVLVALLSGPAARAQDGPPPRERARLTSLDVGPLARSEAVVVGTLRVLVPGDDGSLKVARVDVERTLWGRVDGVAVTVFVGGPRNTADPRRPAEDFLGGQREGRYVLFLSRSPRASGYALESVIPAEGEEGREKAEVLERELGIQALPDDDERARRMLAHLVDLLDAPRPWSRQHAARELDLLSLARPDLFSDDVRAGVAAHRRRTADPVGRARLDRVLERTGGAPAAPTRASPSAPAPVDPEGGPGPRPASPRPAAAPPAPPPASPTDPDLLLARRRLASAVAPEAQRDLLTEVARLARAGAEPDLLAAFEGGSDPIVRERAALLLGDVGARGSLPRLLARFPRETDATVREAVVRAAGLLGDDSVLPFLVERLGEKPLVRAAAFALARVRTGAALDALEGLRVRSSRASPPDEATARLVVYLRSAAFVERERVAGRDVGPRPPVPGAAPGSTGEVCPPQSPAKDAGPR